MSARAYAIACTLLACIGCGGDETISAVARGAELVGDPQFSLSPSNQFACTTCHATAENETRILPGYTLLGAAKRPRLWGGDTPDLKEAVDFCVRFFMRGDRLDRLAPDARALYEYLRSIEDRGPTTALPLTIVRDATIVPARGDPVRGAEVHNLACRTCHGEAKTGSGAIGGAPILPDQAKAAAIAAFPEFMPAQVFVEKVRHGQFFGVGGNMPLFSLEALSDGDLGALLAFYEL